MAIKRTVRYQPKKSFKSFCKNNKIGPNVAILIYLGYLKFIQKLASEALLNAHEKKSRTMLPEHVNAAAKVVFRRLNIED